MTDATLQRLYISDLYNTDKSKEQRDTGWHVDVLIYAFINADVNNHWEGLSAACVCAHKYKKVQMHRKTNRWDSLPRLLATKQKAQEGVECSDMLQQMANLLLFILLFSSHSSATCGGGHTLSESVRPPRNQGCRSFIMKGAGHLELKFPVRERMIFLMLFVHHPWFYKPEGGWKSLWHQWRVCLCEEIIPKNPA